MLGSAAMVRKVISCAIMLALFIGGMAVCVLGLEVWLDGRGGFVAPMMIFGGALFAIVGVVTLAEDFAEAFLHPKGPPALPPAPPRATPQARAGSAPGCPRLPLG